MTERLAIIGSGDLGFQILHHAQNIDKYVSVGFFDDNFIVGEMRHGKPIIGGFKDVFSCYENGEFDCLMIGIGYNHFDLRAAIFEKFFGKIPFAKIISKNAIIDPSSKIASGVIIYPGCIVDANVIISENVLLNIGCVVAHDSFIGKHSFLSPCVKIAGFVKVQEKVNLGTGTVLIDNITISDNIRTGAGSVVVNNLYDKGLYVGIPARFNKP